MAINKKKFAFNPLTQQLDLTNDVSQMVDGPSSASDLAIAIYDGTSGKLLQNSLASVQSDGRITLGADGTASLDAITKQQLDAAIQGVKVKQGVLAATTSDITLSGEQTIDGVSLVAGNRVLVKNQSLSAENGIYIVSAGTWIRSTDADTALEITGAFVSVKNGTDNGSTGWFQSAIVTNLGSDPVTFNQFFGAGTYTADEQGIVLSGSTFSLDLDGSTLSKSATGLRVALLGITNAEISNSAAIAYSKLALSNSIVNADINASAAIAYSKLSLTNSIINADISTTAAIEYSKLEALTVDRALISSASGIVSVSATSALELSYVSGVTSSIQTQLDSKFAYSIQSLSSDTTLSTGITYLLNTSANRTLTLPSPANNAFIAVKDVTGNANENIITIDAGGALIDGQSTYIISSAFENVKLVSDGTNWFLI